MKFERLYLKAFGPFSDRVIDLPTGGAGDLHLIFGPNEAGKSTILRAVTGFLFGIPERTDDNFRHDYTALRVGATLLLDSGERLSLMRRKGRKHTLFAIDETTGAEVTERALPEQTLADVLGGLDQTLYQHLFGLDLKNLIEGGEELLRGEGDVGRSLFQAAAGLATLRDLVSGLDAEADDIFKPRGSTGRLNRALREFDERKRLVRDATVRVTAWEDVERKLRQAESRYRNRREAMQDKRAVQLRLERLRANLPLLAERAAIRAELDELAPVPTLAPDAADRRVTAEERLRAAEETRRMAEARRHELEAQSGRLIVRAGVLEQASAIEQIFHTLVAYRGARDALPLITRERRALTERIHQLLAAIGATEIAIAHADELLPSETLIARVQALIETQTRLDDQIEQLEIRIGARRLAVERLATRFAELPEAAPVAALESSLAQVANLADLEARQRTLDADCAERASAVQRDAAALWSGPAEELPRLAVPLAETADAFAAEFTTLAQDERLTAEQDATLARDLEALRREFNVREATGEIVTQAAVSAARGARDADWRRLRETCIEPANTLPDVAMARSLASTFEGAMREADRLADLLHADTQRVTELETIRQRIADMRNAALRNDARRDLLVERKRDLQTRWEALIAPLRRPELTPAALREWLTRQQRLVDRDADLARSRAERDRVSGEIALDRNVLNAALVACGLPEWCNGEAAASAMERARRAVSAARQAGAERTALTEQLQSGNLEARELDEQRQRLLARLVEWRRHWAEVVQRLRLPDEALPAEARTRLAQLAQLAAALRESAELDAREASQTEIVSQFESRLTVVARAIDEPIAEAALDAIAERLYAALRDTRDAETRRRQLEADLDREVRTLAGAEQTARQATQVLAELVRSAGCGRADELPAIEARAARKTWLGQRGHDIDAQLVQHNARAVADVSAEAEGMTLEEVSRQLEELTREFEDLDRELETAQEALFQARREQQAIDGGAAAADAAQELESLGARIVGEARTYARVRLAGAVLDRVVQLYRERHQGPLLKRAAEVFARITRGGFSGLTIDYADDRQNLVGVRPDGNSVSVAGMSQGTRDQLYLALRLAAIEQHVASRGPFPVIVDDLLVQFDDERALATLEILTELSTRTQVLCFTHHRHLVDLVAHSRLAPAVRTLTL